MTLTKEWLLKTITELEEERDATPGAVNEDAAKALAAMKLALASLEAKPVAYMYKDNLHADARFSLHTRFGNWSQEDINEYEITEIPLYAAPPAPVSDSLLSELLGIAKRAADKADECAHAEFSDDSMEHSAAIANWEHRAAMLQGADGKSPVIPDGWVMLPAEPTQAMMNAWLSEVANWRGHAAGYRAMIAAAPQQEVK